MANKTNQPTNQPTEPNRTETNRTEMKSRVIHEKLNGSSASEEIATIL